MAKTLERILLIGATGTIGMPILDAFRGSIGEFKRLAIVTSQNTHESKLALMKELQSDGVEVITADISDPTEMKEIFNGFDTIISALGRGALHLQPGIIDAVAALEPPRRFYPSEYGTDIRYDPETSPHEKPHQEKLKVRSHLEALANQGKITFTYIVTGPFADTFFSLRGVAGYLPSSNTYRILGPSDINKQEKISGTTYSDTARFVLSSVLTPDASENATLRVSSFTAKPGEIQKAVETVVGKKLKTEYVELDEIRAIEKQKWEEKDPLATLYTLSRLWYEGRSDFTRRPAALYLRDGKEVEDKELEAKLWQDVPRRELVEVVKEVLGTQSRL